MRRRLHGMLLLLLLASPASAADDGGTVSVFAYGAGNRLLGMGGAGAAASGEADLFFANPGTLGTLMRPEFQAGHASLYGLGIGEQYALLVWPDHRWGVLGLGLRHLGVGDIDGRDDRNVPLDGTLSSVDQQLTLGYGRSLGRAWQLGAGLNLRRQELAGYAGGGIGMDLGLQFLPAVAMGFEDGALAGLRCGFVLRNAVQPGIRLDQDRVVDPTAVRVGLAHSTSLRGFPLRAACDLEKIRNRELRAHAGLELEVTLLTLRVGWGYERLGAGAGLRWRDLRLDYVFEDNPLEPVHRFGMSLRFGKDVRVRRQEALAAADAALQDRLEASFRERQMQRVAQLMAEATTARSDGRTEEALRLLSTVQAIAPDDPKVVALTAACHVDIAKRAEAAGEFGTAALSYQHALDHIPDHPRIVESLERCLSESARHARRSEALRGKYAIALDAFAAGEFIAARAGFQAILDSEPGDGDAAAMLRRCDDALETRLGSLLDQAARYAARSFIAEAEDLLGQAVAIDDGDRRIGELRGRLAELRRGADSSPAAAPTARVESAPVPAAGSSAPRRLNEAERRELADLYRRGNAAAESGNRDDALRYWEMVWSRRPGFQQVDRFLKREYLMQGMELFAGGRLDEAAALWEKALQVDPTDERARGYLARAREQLARTEEIFKQ